MELSRYVADTISQLVKGVRDAQAEAGRNGAVVVPYLTSFPGGHNQDMFLTNGQGLVTLVRFDVAVCVSESSAMGAGAGISVVPVVRIGAKGESTQSNSAINRIQFVLPVCFATEAEAKANIEQRAKAS